MKILLTMHLPYIPALGGANKCNRLLAEGLAQLAHEVHVIVPTTNETNALATMSFHDQLAAQGIHMESQSGVERFQLEGVNVHALNDPTQVRSHLVKQIKSLKPDWILVSGEEWSQGLLEAALQVAPSRVIYLVHTVLFLPFGPQAFFPSERRTQLVEQAAHIVACGEFVHDYIQRWSGLESTVFHFPAYGSGPFPQLGRFENEFVTLINPSVGKGLDIFLSLAQSLPNVRFACIPTWGTTERDRTQLDGLSNMTILTPSEDIDHIFSKTKILLLPSLWPEGFPLTTIEAMLRGIPVLGSDAGGIPESKLGTDFVLPVLPIESFTEELDERLLPIPHLPTQSREVLTQWTDALRHLISDQTLYERQAFEARTAAQQFVSGLSVEPFEMMLRDLEARTAALSSQRRTNLTSPPLSPQEAEKSDRSARLARITPDQQALLFQWLQTAASEGQRLAYMPSLAKHDIDVDAGDRSFAELLDSIDALSEEEAQALLEKEGKESDN